MSNDTELALPPLPESVNAGRVPTWDLASVRHRPCPVCRSDMPQIVCSRPDHLKVGRCPQCEMVYLPEVPSDEEITKFYRNYGSFKLLEAQRLSWLQLVKASVTDQRIRILETTGGLQGLSLVDVGCAFGHFLQLARYCGAKVAGIELDAQARASLQSLGISARERFHGDEQADIVCAFQLIEHLKNPCDLLDQISKALVDDGRVLLELPNGGECEQAGASWLGFRVDLEHFNYFSLKTLSRLLAKLGMYVEQYWLHSQPRISRNSTTKLGFSHFRLAAHRTKRIAHQIITNSAFPPVWHTGNFVITVLARRISRRIA